MKASARAAAHPLHHSPRAKSQQPTARGRRPLAPAYTATDEAPDVRIDSGLDLHVAVGVDAVALRVAPGRALRLQVIGARRQAAKASPPLLVRRLRPQRPAVPGRRVEAELQIGPGFGALPEPVVPLLRLRQVAD